MVVSWDEKIAGVKGNSKKAKLMRAYFQQQKEMDEKIKRGLTHEDHLVRMGMSTAGVSKAEATRAVTGRGASGGKRRKGGKRTKRRGRKSRRSARRGGGVSSYYEMGYDMGVRGGHDIDGLGLTPGVTPQDLRDYEVGEEDGRRDRRAAAVASFKEYPKGVKRGGSRRTKGRASKKSKRRSYKGRGGWDTGNPTGVAGSGTDAGVTCDKEAGIKFGVHLSGGRKRRASKKSKRAGSK